MVPAERSAFRSLLRLCRHLDAQPGHLAALLGRPPRRYHPGLRRLVRVPASRWPFVDDAVWEALGRSSEYARPERGSARAAARLHRHRVGMLGLGYGPDAKELLGRLSAVRDFMEGLRGEGCEEAAAPAEEPRLKLQLAGSSDPVRVGDILVTHPLSCLWQPELDKAVVIIEEIDEEAGAVHGLALNKPDGATLGEAMSTNPASAAEEGVDLEPLLAAPMYIGGDLVTRSEDLLRRVSWVHGLGDRLPGSRRLLPGVFLGGELAAAAELVRSGEVAAADLRPVLGFAGWEQTQLELELERGVWVRARAQEGDCCGPLLTHGEVATWRGALRAAGMAALADMPRDLAADEKLRAWVEAHNEAQVQELLGEASSLAV